MTGVIFYWEPIGNLFLLKIYFYLLKIMCTVFICVEHVYMRYPQRLEHQIPPELE